VLEDGVVPSTVAPAGATVQGVDVSVNQGIIDWNTVKASGVEFAYARVSDGTLLDSEFQQNWQGMQAAGVARGAYQFFEPGGPQDTLLVVSFNDIDLLIAASGHAQNPKVELLHATFQHASGAWTGT
jgi:hypothetical protein